MDAADDDCPKYPPVSAAAFPELTHHLPRRSPLWWCFREVEAAAAHIECDAAPWLAGDWPDAKFAELWRELAESAVACAEVLELPPAERKYPLPHWPWVKEWCGDGRDPAKLFAPE